MHYEEGKVKQKEKQSEWTSRTIDANSISKYFGGSMENVSKKETKIHASK